MSKNQSQTEIHRFYCTRCGNEGIPIIRKKGKIRPRKHLKKLYCLHCNDYVNHCEILSEGAYQYEDFLVDFNNGVFESGDKR